MAICAEDGCGWLLSGNLYFGKSENSNLFRHVGEADKFAITTATEKKAFVSKRPLQYGQDACAVYVAQATEIAISLRSTNMENLKLMFLGEEADTTSMSGFVTSKSITAANDSCQFLPHRNISNVVLTDDTEVTTYVDGTDYSLDTTSGILKTLSTGSIVDESALKISYDYRAFSGYKIDGGKFGSVTIPVKLVGKNLANDREVVFFAPSCVITSSTEIDFLQDDFITIELTGTLQIGSDGTLFSVDSASYT